MDNLPEDLTQALPEVPPSKDKAPPAWDDTPAPPSPKGDQSIRAPSRSIPRPPPSIHLLRPKILFSDATKTPAAELPAANPEVAISPVPGVKKARSLLDILEAKRRNIDQFKPDDDDKEKPESGARPRVFKSICTTSPTTTTAAAAETPATWSAVTRSSNVDDILSFKKEMLKLDDLVYVGDAALAADAKVPSTCFVEDGVSLIRVFRQAADIVVEDKLESYKTGKEKKIKADFAKIWNDKRGKVHLKSTVQALSQRNNYTTGKWLISVGWKDADKVWDSVKTAFIEGKFSDEVRYIKVYGRQEDERNPHYRVSTLNSAYDYNAMISMMTSNWTDRAKTMEVARIAEQAGVGVRMRYKPDICTCLEIYRGNDYGMRPTVYTYP